MINDKTIELGNEPIVKLMWKYFLPAVIGLLSQTLYNFIDRVYIGQIVGVDALAGLTLVFPIMMMVMAFGTLTGMGTGILVSINMGKKKLEKAEKILGVGFTAQIVISLLVILTIILIKTPLLEWFQPTQSTFQYADQYLNIILFGIIFQTTGWGMNNVIRSQGYVKTAMYSMIISAFLNIIFDAIFIIGLDMGVQGAALATVLSQILLSVWIIYHITNKKALVRLKFANVKINLKYLKEICAVGFASFAMHFAAAGVSVIQNAQLIKYGADVAVAAMGIITGVNQIVFMMLIGVNMASQPILSFNYGAKNFLRVKQTLKVALLWATILSLLGFAMGEFIPGFMIKLFNANDAQLLEIGTRGMKICFMLFPFIGFQVVVSSYFQSAGMAKTAAVISLLRQVIFLIPLFFILPNYYGLDGVWYSRPLSDAMAFAISSIVFIFAWKKIPKTNTP